MAVTFAAPDSGGGGAPSPLLLLLLLPSWEGVAGAEGALTRGLTSARKNFAAVSRQLQLPSNSSAESCDGAERTPRMFKSATTVAPPLMDPPLSVEVLGLARLLRVSLPPPSLSTAPGTEKVPGLLTCAVAENDAQSSTAAPSSIARLHEEERGEEDEPYLCLHSTI
jgi:hypothetical protein